MDLGFFKWLTQFLVEHPTFAPLIISLLFNGVTVFAIKSLYSTNVQSQKDTNAAIGKLSEVISTMNTLLNLLVAGKRGR